VSQRGRPLLRGAAAFAQDISTLAKIMRRVEEDAKRPEKDRAALISCLQKAITLLASGQRETKPGKAA
jgi:hypothetical protein